MSLVPIKPLPFVCLEGGEGVGKSTLAQGLTEWLSSLGYEVLKTREPGGTDLGSQIRKIFLEAPEGSAIDPLAELFLMNAARAQHVSERVQPALARGAWVICDRFADSSLVYQGIIGGLGLDKVRQINQVAIRETEPGLVLILDCDTQISQQRLATRGLEQSRLDRAPLATHNRIRQAFLSLALEQPQLYRVVNAGESSMNLLIEAKNILLERFASTLRGH